MPNPRKRRPLRPSVICLEAINCVSNLVPGVLPASGSVGGSSPDAAVGSSLPVAIGTEVASVFTVATAQPPLPAETRRLFASRPRIKPTTALRSSSPMALATSVIDARPRPDAVTITPPIALQSQASGAQSKMYGTAGVIRPLMLAPTPAAQVQPTGSPQNAVLTSQDTGNPSYDAGASSGNSSGGYPVPNDSGGGLFYPPLISLQDNNSGTEYRGSKASYTLLAPSGFTITNVNWGNNDIVDGLKTPSASDGNLIYPTTNVSTNHSATITGYWGPSGGTTSESLGPQIMVQDGYGNAWVENNNYSITLSPITVTLSREWQPSSNFLPNNGNPLLSYGGDAGGEGISWTTTSSVGTTLTIQLITGGNASESPTNPAPGGTHYVGFAQPGTNTNSSQPANFDLLDVLNASASPEYPFSADSPNLTLENDMNSARYQAQFLDFVFVKLPGGISVPFGTWEWQISMNASNTTGTWTSSSTTVTDSTAPGPTNALTFSVALPHWNDVATNWKTLVQLTY